MEEQEETERSSGGRTTCVLYVGAARQPSLVVEHCSVPSSLAPGEVLLALKLAAVCPSLDLPPQMHAVHTAGRRETVPRVPGHEAVGEVLLSRRPDVQPGERLVFAAVGGCGDCSHCTRLGHTLDCPNLIRYGHSCFTASPGLSGTYASHMVVRAGTRVAQVPACISNHTALTASCRLAPLLWGMKKALALMQENSMKTALVQGCGMRGVLSCAVLHEHGFHVSCTDPDPARLRLAQRFGAHPIYGAAESAENLSWRDVPSGFQLVVRACSSRRVLSSALAALAQGGTYLLLGGLCSGDAGALPVADVCAKSLHVLGVPEQYPEGLEQAVAFLEATHAKFPYESLFSPPYTFADIQAALRLAREKKFLRVALKTESG